MAASSGGILTLRRLRLGLVASALTLLLVVAGFVGYGRYLAHKLRIKLPGGIALNFEQETDGFTISPSKGARTYFTLHAARQIHHRDGKFTLKDVGITLYGAKGDRTDHIHGDHFEYDPKEQVLTAVGAVYLDLAPPVRTSAKGKALDESLRTIHVKSDGLVYRQKEETATTDGGIEFMASGMTGTAVGAEYDAARGTVVLRSNVKVSGLRGRTGSGAESERPMVLTAGHAELHREDNVAVLEGAKVIAATDRGTDTGAADRAVAHLTPDGDLERLEANGRVLLTGEGRGVVTAERLEMGLNAAGQPSSTHLWGSVRFRSDREARSANGEANDVRVLFDGRGRPVHALATGRVEATQTAGTSTRALLAERVELGLGGGGAEPVAVRSAVASGQAGAHLRLVDAASGKDGKGKAVPAVLRTTVTADTLSARFAAGAAPGNRQSEVSGLDGAGQTMVERTLAEGLASSPGATLWKENSTGDTLRLELGAAEPAPGRRSRTELLRAEQSGSVRIVREIRKPGAAGGVERERAQGDEAIYDAVSDRMTLRGAAAITDAESALFADRVELDRVSGDVTAEGSVRVSYLQPGGTGEPVHVLAGRAVGHKGTGVTQFFAAAGASAKMWQGGSQVEAPELDFDRTRRTLQAHGAGTSAPVKTVLVDASAAGGKAPVAKGASNQPAARGPVRVLSREMLYSDGARQVVFRGAVQVRDSDGSMRAGETTVSLAAKDTRDVNAARDPGPAMTLGGRVDRIVATGAVELDQPGRKATGERLVYTAADTMFVLSGTQAVPPKMMDEARGTVTGAELRFRTGDDSVEVRGGEGSERVHTETRMKGRE